MDLKKNQILRSKLKGDTFNLDKFLFKNTKVEKSLPSREIILPKQIQVQDK